ncbi:MAG TPA: OpgC domain-containing protein [Vicinamibacterales bacterium]|nr:OpgC domain-containing protein [Vicinamibacterales bacterium]
MLRGWQYTSNGPRDLRLDWLRGLAMTCVIVDHSKLRSLLSWFSYERFWTVTAAEVFVVLSGTVLGMVYGTKLRRGQWRGVVRGLGKRALTLWLVFVAVTVSIAILARCGVDVEALTTWGDGVVAPFDPHRLDAGALREIVLMRAGPWAFEIVALYVWLVIAAIPSLLLLRFVGWRALIAGSWALYVLHRIAPHALTAAHFEATFPILVWQLLFVHGIAIGYERERIHRLVTQLPRVLPSVAIAASALFIVFALSNPWSDGPSVLRWTLVSEDRFVDLYWRYFSLSELGIGRLLNLAAALPLGYAMLTIFWKVASPVGRVLVTLGQQSLGAFVLHVYAILLMAHLPLHENGLWVNTLLQVAVILGIAGVLAVLQRRPDRRMTSPTAKLHALTAG